MPPLFDDIERTDAGPATHRESTFGFYNRVAAAGWSRVRDEIEGWFTSYCADADREKANDLRARFRSANSRQHHAAWWELYVHRLLRALYPYEELTCEPELTSGTRPDFAVVSPETRRVRLFVECTTATSGIVDDRISNGALLAFVLDTINEVESEHFFIHLSVLSYGTSQPGKREIQGPLREWLTTLDYATVRELGAGARTLSRQIEFRDWLLEAWPVAKREPRRGERLIGFGPSSGGFINDATALRNAVDGKATRYGLLDAPFVIAVAPTAPLVHDDDVARALLWTRQQQFDPTHPEGGETILLLDGAFYRRAAGVAGVMLGSEVLPWTIARTPPTLWLNPRLTLPPDEPLEGLPTVSATDAGDLHRAEGPSTIAALLQLDPEWPGELWDD